MNHPGCLSVNHQGPVSWVTPIHNTSQQHHYGATIPYHEPLDSTSKTGITSLCLMCWGHSVASPVDGSPSPHSWPEKKKKQKTIALIMLCVLSSSGFLSKFLLYSCRKHKDLIEGKKEIKTEMRRRKWCCSLSYSCQICVILINRDPVHSWFITRA